MPPRIHSKFIHEIHNIKNENGRLYNINIGMKKYNITIVLLKNNIE